MNDDEDTSPPGAEAELQPACRHALFKDDGVWFEPMSFEMDHRERVKAQLATLRPGWRRDRGATIAWTSFRRFGATPKRFV